TGAGYHSCPDQVRSALPQCSRAPREIPVFLHEIGLSFLRTSNAGCCEHFVKDGTRMIRKTAVQIGVAVLFALIVWNGYVVVGYVKQMQRLAALTVQSSAIRAEISGVLKDLTDMEAGQRGYLITNNSSYLQLYTEAKDRIAA